jgi:hypothetical protein
MNIGGIIRGASESVSGAIRAYGSKRSAAKESEGYKKADVFYNRMLEEAGKSREMADPFSQYRAKAAERLYNLTLSGDTSAALEQDPGYQFRLQEGTRQTERAMASRGMNVSGNVLAALQERGQGLASQEYGAAVSRLMELGGGYASNAVAGANIYSGMTMSGLEGLAGSEIGAGFAKARGSAGYYEYHAQANAAAGRGVASIWEMPGAGGGGGGGGAGGGGAGGGIGGMMGSIGSMFGG